MGRLNQCCIAFIFFISGVCSTLWIMKLLTGWSWYHLRMRTFIVIASYRARDAHLSICYSQDNQTIISCELAAMTRIIQFRFTKDLKYNTYNHPDTIIPYSRDQMHILWNVTFPYPTHLPISITNDIIHNYNSLWIVNRKIKNTNTPLTPSELSQMKTNLPKTGVIVAIHGGALVMGSAGHLIPYLTLLSSFMSDILPNMSDTPPPMISFDYRLAPECIFPCQSVDVSFMINKYLHSELGIPMHKIYLIGDSSGASLALLFMQKISAFANGHILSNVGGAVLISPGCDWTLNDGKGSWDRNAEFDPIIFYDSIKLYRNYVFGIYETDKQTLHKSVRRNDIAHDQQTCESLEGKIEFNSPKMSPCFGTFEGLPSLYITVSELELLFDDANMVYERAIEGKDSVVKRKEEYRDIMYFLEVNKGSSLHELPLMAGVIPEATKTLRNIAYFLVNLTSDNDRSIYI